MFPDQRHSTLRVTTEVRMISFNLKMISKPYCAFSGGQIHYERAVTIFQDILPSVVLSPYWRLSDILIFVGSKFFSTPISRRSKSPPTVQGILWNLEWPESRNFTMQGRQKKWSDWVSPVYCYGYMYLGLARLNSYIFIVDTTLPLMTLRANLTPATIKSKWYFLFSKMTELEKTIFKVTSLP